MLNRRHIRIKVMQNIYAMHQQQSSDLTKQEKSLFLSIEDIFDLYLIVTSSLVEIKNMEENFINKSKLKRIKSKEDENPNTNFINNSVLAVLSESVALKNALEKRRITNWSIDDSYLKLLLDEIKENQLYIDYIKLSEPTHKDDQQFIINLFTEVVAPNEKLNDYLEDLNISWSDDIPIVNTLILKQLGRIKPNKDNSFKIPAIYKDAEDKEYARKLFRKVVLLNEELAKEFADKTPNWDADRIAELDRTILKMAIAEFLHFPSVPIKVTINEYVEIAKEYATPKSSIFINGILDKLSKEYIANKKAVKIGRGLL